MLQLDQVLLGSYAIAQKEAMELKHTELFPETFLLALIKNKSSYLSRVFKDDEAMIKLELNKRPKASKELPIDQLRPSAELSKWFTLAQANATEQGQVEIAEKHLLPYLAKFFSHLNLDLSKLSDDQQGAGELPNFLIDLNEKAKSGKLDPVIGRTKEIRAVMEILGRRNKNNPVLVGPAGVGKTAIVEGLAEQIVKGAVPDVLKDKIVYALDFGSLMAGTKYRGDFEERIQQLIKFIKGQNGLAILFIDEIHQLVGAGKTDGAMDGANLLKPALARGELHAIGATTPEEYQKYILGDAALDRRFRPVPVDEPSKEDAIEILMGIKPKHEMHHGIKISDDAIYSAVFLSDQYITDKNLPDKAIDLIDEAASGLKLSAQALPRELEELEAEIRSKNVLSNFEKDNVTLKKEIENLTKKFEVEKKQWLKEVESLTKLSEIKNRLERYQLDLAKFEREQNYEEASRLKYSMIPEVQKELALVEHSWILSREHIAQVISRQTGIPIDKILQTRQENILHLEEHLKSRVFGQDESLHEIAETLLSSYAGLSDEKKPLGTFLLLGPTGVGKTETAKALAQFLFESDEHIIRLDLSEYSEKHSVAKLIGAPAGYVGYDEGGILTEAVRKKPYSIILFDELEKAHHDFSDILLQILDEGRLTDNKGRTINFKNTIILMTSNSKNIEADFKPEVLGRMDAILHYNSLDQKVMSELIAKQLRQLNERLKGKKIKAKLSEHLISVLAERGYDQKFGARPLNTIFNKMILRPLSHLLMSEEIKEKSLLLDWRDSELKITIE